MIYGPANPALHRTAHSRCSFAAGERNRWGQTEMVLPEMNQPSIQEIEAELGAFKRWQLAYLRNEHPLPDLPIAPDERSTFTLLYGLVVQSVLILLGWIAKLTQLRSLRVWAARR